MQALRALVGQGPVTALMVQRRYLPQAPAECVAGQLPETVFARRGEARFAIQLGEQQNTGFFLDMEPGRRWLEARANGKRLLNLFAYTCAFSVVAQLAGAASVLNVDMSRAALNRGRDNHRLNSLPTNSIRFLQADILKSWGRIRRPGPFDVAIFDPPSFQPGSFEARRDYSGGWLMVLSECAGVGGGFFAAVGGGGVSAVRVCRAFDTFTRLMWMQGSN